MYVVSVCYYRALELPIMLFENCGYYSSEDFEPSDVTWVGEYSITHVTSEGSKSSEE